MPHFTFHIGQIKTLDERGVTLELQVLKRKFGIAGTFIDYEQVLQNIPRDWLKMVANTTTGMPLYNDIHYKADSVIALI